jgi:hypothetical protein
MREVDAMRRYERLQKVDALANKRFAENKAINDRRWQHTLDREKIQDNNLKTSNELNKIKLNEAKKAIKDKEIQKYKDSYANDIMAGLGDNLGLEKAVDRAIENNSSAGRLTFDQRRDVVNKIKRDFIDEQRKAQLSRLGKTKSKSTTGDLNDLIEDYYKTKISIGALYDLQTSGKDQSKKIKALKEKLDYLESKITLPSS